MLLSFAARRLFLLTLLVSVALSPTDASPGSVADSRPAGPPVRNPDWMRDYTPTQFRRLSAAQQPIDPAAFQEALLAAAIFQETNQQRADLRLPAFQPDEDASRAARRHAGWMASAHTLAHNEPSDRGTPITALDRLVQQGLRPRATAENIAFNLLPNLAPGRRFYTRLEQGRPVFSYQPGGAALRAHTYDDFARTMVAQWMHSPLHRAHLVDPGLRFLGVGVALAHRHGHPDTIYGTQDFFTPRTLSPAPGASFFRASLQLEQPRPGGN